MTRRETDEERFERQVDRSDPTGCHPWRAGRNPAGYGCFSLRGRRVLAHRYTWMLHHGAIADGLKVCHVCDNPPCQNPGHLFLGTQAENVADRDRKGRQAPHHGEHNGRHKLTVDDVRLIRLRCAGGERQAHVAHDFGVSRKTVNHIVHRRLWRSV